MENYPYQVAIIGANILQNSVLACFLESQSEWKTAVFENLSQVQTGLVESKDGRVVVLFDCFNFEKNWVEASVAVEIEKIPAEWAFTLFNLEETSVVERLALEYGVQGFFYQHDSAETLLKGIGSLFRGELWVSRRTLTETITEHALGIRHHRELELPKGLTRREVEILRHLVEGCSNKCIAKKMYISPDTVRTHLHRIFGKLEISSRLEASIWAAENLMHTVQTQGKKTQP